MSVKDIWSDLILECTATDSLLKMNKSNTCDCRLFLQGNQMLHLTVPVAFML